MSHGLVKAIHPGCCQGDWQARKKPLPKKTASVPLTVQERTDAVQARLDRIRSTHNHSTITSKGVSYEDESLNHIT